MTTAQIVIFSVFAVIYTLLVAIDLYKNDTTYTGSIIRFLLFLFILCIAIVLCVDNNQSRKGCPELIKAEDVYRIKQ